MFMLFWKGEEIVQKHHHLMTLIHLRYIFFVITSTPKAYLKKNEEHEKRDITDN